jgi:hypothetical protein
LVSQVVPNGRHKNNVRSYLTPAYIQGGISKSNAAQVVIKTRIFVTNSGR